MKFSSFDFFSTIEKRKKKFLVHSHTGSALVWPMSQSANPLTWPNVMGVWAAIKKN